MLEEKTIVKPKIDKDKILQMSHDFYNTKKAFIVLIGINAIFSVIQIILFATGNLPMGLDGITVDSSEAWIGWTSLALSSVGVTFQFIGIIYSMRFNQRKEIIFLPIGLILITMNAILMKLYLMALTYALSIVLAIIRFFVWGKDEDDTDKTTKKYWFWLSMFSIAFMAIFVPIYALEIIPFSGDGSSTEFLKYVDIINSVLILAATATLTMKSKWTFVLFGLSGITSILILGMTNQIIVLVSIIILKFNDALSYMAWTSKDKKIAEAEAMNIVGIKDGTPTTSKNKEAAKTEVKETPILKDGEMTTSKDDKLKTSKKTPPKKDTTNPPKKKIPPVKKETTPNNKEKTTPK